MTKYTLAPLPYAYDALEPYIDAKTMELHHDKHHQAYTDKLNAALEQAPELDNTTIEKLLSNPSQIPEKIRQAVINHGGGYVNHNFFWQVMEPVGNKKEDNNPTGELKSVLEAKFTSIEKFKEEFANAALNRFGSGWAWLVLNQDKKLEIIATANQDSPLTLNQIPILTVDVWEHAYYLKYQNRRPEYIENWWHVVNWEKVAELYNQGKK